MAWVRVAVQLLSSPGHRIGIGTCMTSIEGREMGYAMYEGPPVLLVSLVYQYKEQDSADIDRPAELSPFAARYRLHSGCLRNVNCLC